MFSWLFGGSKSANTVVDTVSESVKGIGSWIDEQQFTDQERAEQKKELTQQHMEFLKVAYDENSVRSVTRRVMAWVIVIDVIILANISVFLSIQGNTEAVKAIVDIANSFWLGEGFLAIIGFYFGITFLRSRNK